LGQEQELTFNDHEGSRYPVPALTQTTVRHDRLSSTLNVTLRDNGDALIPAVPALRAPIAHGLSHCVTRWICLRDAIRLVQWQTASCSALAGGTWTLVRDGQEGASKSALSPLATLQASARIRRPSSRAAFG
jgi:hypothetical protein